MATVTMPTGNLTMAKKTTPPPVDRDRLDLRAEPELIARVKTQAKRLGKGISAYIREATTRMVEADEANDPGLGRKK